MNAGAAAGIGGTGISGGGASGGLAGYPPACQASPVTCNGTIYTGSLSGPCSEEGATCSGFACFDLRGGYDFSAICCHGAWRVNQGGVVECPPDSQTFQCQQRAECTVGESYCRTSPGPSPQDPLEVSCEPLCKAGDCSCFCDPDDLGSCSFSPDTSCPFDSCECSIFKAGHTPPGSVVVNCNVDVEQSGTCGQATQFDAACADAGLGAYAWLCFGDRFDGTPLPGAPPVTCGVVGTYVCW